MLNGSETVRDTDIVRPTIEYKGGFTHALPTSVVLNELE